MSSNESGAMKRRFGSILLVAVTLLGMIFWTAQIHPQPKLDTVKKNIEVFEGILTTVLQQTFTDPFAVLEKPKGVYLDGFGTVFSFEIDIATVKRPNLFSSAHSTPEEEKKFFNENLAKLKEVMIRALAEHGDSMVSLQPDETIAVAAQLFNSGFLSQPLELRTVLIRTAKKNLVDYKAGRLTSDELRKKIEVIQY